MGAKRTAHAYQIGEVVNGELKILEQIRMPLGKKYTKKGYVVQSMVYPTSEPYKKCESTLKDGQGCAYKAGQRVCLENSLWSVESIRGNIIDIDEAKQVTPGIAKKILFQCEHEDCDNTKMMTPSNLLHQGFACNICSKSTSYPELWFMGYNKEKNAGFIPQQRFDDFKGHIFDNVNYESRIIVETHGIQHYEDRDGKAWKGAHKKSVASDKRKRKYCKENNWTLIELDCRYSEFEHIRNSVANDPLLDDVTDDDVKGMMEIIEKNKRYPTKKIIRLYTLDKLSTYKIADKLGLTREIVTRVLDKNNIKLRIGGIQVGSIAHNRKRVRCIETGRMYESIHEVHEETGISESNISGCCKGKRKTAGGYTWEYVPQNEKKTPSNN